MNKNIVIISIEKIQKYICSVLDERDVVIQKDKGTLSSIIAASNTVSSQINKIIDEKLIIKKEDVILRISGKLIFITKKSEKELLCILDEIFKYAYLKYSGKVFLNYKLFSYDSNLNKRAIIKKALEELKKNSPKRDIILRNSDALFRINEVKKFTTEYKEGLPDYMNVYLDDMDSLVDYKNIAEDGTNGKIAIIKADINNLGQFFMEAETYGEYIRVSDYLKKTISLEYFAEKLRESRLSKKVLPIYIAGDDIFYAVKMDAVLQTVEVLKKMVEEINKNISQNTNNKLSLAVGCVFVNNHQPIRYYKDVVEEELSIIKNKMKTDDSLKTILGLRILDNDFYFYKEKNKENNNLDKFIKEISDLKFLMYKRALTNSFMYKLIYDIEHEKDEKKAMNLVLHHSRPVIGLSKNFIYDMILKHYFLSFLVEDKKDKKAKGKQKERKFLSDNINKKLLPRLKLIAMLLDEKYYSNSSDGEETNCEYRGDIFKAEDIKTNLFNRPLNYLSDNSTELAKLFLGKEKDCGETLYKKLKIDKGTLFKCKKLIDREKSELVYDVIVNNLNIKAVEESDNSLLKNKYIKDFSIKRGEFDNLIKTAPNDWIDEVIIYYEYIEQRKEYFINKTYQEALKEYKAKDEKRQEGAHSKRSRRKIYNQDKIY